MESFSVNTVVAILSSPAPPYSSGMPPLMIPSSAPFRTISAINPGFLFSNSFTKGMTSLVTNSSAVCPINFWSSERSAGVNTSWGKGDSSRKLPPSAAGLFKVAVAIEYPPSFQRPGMQCPGSQRNIILRLDPSPSNSAHRCDSVPTREVTEPAIPLRDLCVKSPLSCLLFLLQVRISHFQPPHHLIPHGPRKGYRPKVPTPAASQKHRS